MGNNLDVDGKRNRVAGRDFYELTVVPESAEKVYLVTAQRKHLNKLVAEVGQECDLADFALWREVHAQLGVESIKEITRDQFQDALDVLESRRREYREQRARHDLTEKILRIAQCKGIVVEMGRFCFREFGEQELEALGRVELLRALAFVDDHAGPAAVPTATKPGRIPLHRLVISHPVHTAVLVGIGIVIGLLLY